MSNKTVLYELRDGIVSISYTGLAYLEGVPTDRWIAQKLCGDELLERFSLRSGLSKQNLGIAEAEQLLLHEVERYFASLPRGQRSLQQFSIAGWQSRKARIHRPILECITNSDEDRAKFAIYRNPRNWHHDIDTFLVDIKPVMHPLRRGQLERLLVLLQAHAMSSYDICEQLLTKAIRLASSEVPALIGPHCMSVLMSPPPIGIARVRYLPLGEEWGQAAVQFGEERETMPAAFTPWIGSRVGILAPSVTIGGVPITPRCERYSVNIEVPPAGANSKVIAAMSSQRRPSAPR